MVVADLGEALPGSVTSSGNAATVDRTGTRLPGRLSPPEALAGTSERSLPGGTGN